VSAAISGCRSLLKSPRDIFFELAVVENRRFAVVRSMSHLLVDTFIQFAVVENCVFATRITIILTSEAFGCISQHKR